MSQMSMILSQIPQQLINGLSIGSVYALIAIGYTMVYGIIGMINFAHGEIYMLGAYIGMIVLTVIFTTVGFDSWLPIGVILIIVLCSSIFVTSLYGYTIERLAYRPVRKSPRLVALISAIGMSVFLQNWVALGQGAQDATVPNLIQGQVEFSLHPMFQDVTVSYARMLVLVTTIILMIGITLYIKYSRLGRAARACSQDIHMANLLGINTNQVISFVFVMGAGLAAIGGVLNAITYTKIEPFKLGFIAGMKAFTAAVLGGIGSIPGAMLGGLLLGLAETFAASFWSDSYKDIVAFTVLVLVLLFKPTGLLGKPEVEKV